MLRNAMWTVMIAFVAIAGGCPAPKDPPKPDNFEIVDLLVFSLMLGVFAFVAWRSTRRIAAPAI